MSNCSAASDNNESHSEVESTLRVDTCNAETNTEPNSGKTVAVGSDEGPCQCCSDEISKKLSELNEEIAAFRKDNALLQDVRRQLQEDKSAFEKEILSIRHTFEDEKRVFMAELDEAKARLDKEKQMFEKFVTV